MLVFLLLWPPCVADTDIIFSSCQFSLFSSPNISRRRLECLPYFHTWCGLSPTLSCRSETCCTRLAAKTICKKIVKNRHLGTIAQICRARKARTVRIDNRKNVLSTNISPTCPYNMVNFGLLAAEIDPVVWGIPANFNGFRVLAALLHSTRVLGVSQTLRR